MGELMKPSLDVGMLYGYTEYLRMWELQRGRIRIFDSMSSSEAERVGRESRWLIQNHKTGEVQVYICSPGGGAYHAFAIYDQLRRLDKHIQVTTHVEGWAASAACMIVLQAGRDRVATPSSRFLLHEVRRWVFFATERTSDLVDEVTEMKAIERQIVQLLASRCSKTEEEVREFISRRERWMSAQEALDWGLIDRLEGL